MSAFEKAAFVLSVKFGGWDIFHHDMAIFFMVCFGSFSFSDWKHEV